MDILLQAGEQVRLDKIASHRAELVKLGCGGADLESRVALFIRNFDMKLHARTPDTRRLADVSDAALIASLGGGIGQ